MKPKYTVVVYTPQELNHSSYMQTGLFELEEQGLIKVKVVLSVKKNLGRYKVSDSGAVVITSQAAPKTSFYKLIDHKSGQEINFAADLYDFANQFSQTALNNCDFYFKRSFESKFTKQLSEELQAKIFKLGITFGNHSEHKHGNTTFKQGLYLSNLLLNFKKDRSVLTRLIKTYKAQKNHWKFVNTTREISRFEDYTPATDTSILFQTRCFLHEDDLDVKQIHQQRYHIIKLLRDQFPQHFKGGFVSSKIAVENYKDAITNVPSAPEKYLDVVKKSKIVIYTRGLANSPAWKMAEYLSQGKVIIAEPLTTELSVPLIDGREVLFFRSDTELIEKINLVLEDKGLAAELSRNARAYFEAHVHPVQNTKRILELMLNKTLV